MTISTFIPEVWSSSLMTNLQKSLVFGGAVNRDYENDISQVGSSVVINLLGDVTVRSYDKTTPITVEDLSTTSQTLTVDQADYFAFGVDDIDKRQAANGGSLISQATLNAAYKQRDKADSYVAGLMAHAGTPLGVVDGTTASNVYDNLAVGAGIALDNANVPSEGRFLIVSPAVYGKLLLDQRFVSASEAANATLHNGIVGSAAGFTVMKSNNVAQANRAIASVTTVSGAKSLTAAAGTFSQGDVGLTVTGTGIGSSNKIASVSADGSVAQTTVNQTASATVTDVALSGGGQLAFAGHADGTTFVDQILQVEAYRSQSNFKDVVRGLHVYAGKVTRPTSVVVSSVKVS